MKPDLADKLQTAMRGEITPKTGVTGVTGVAGGVRYVYKSLKLQWLRQLRVKTNKVANDAIRGVVGGVAASPEPGEVEIEERKGMAMDSVPERYLDAFGRGCKSKSRSWFRMRIGAKPSTMRAGFSTNGASLPIASAGRRAICSMCRATAPWALFGGSR
jgi:hypothetical protein